MQLHDQTCVSTPFRLEPTENDPFPGVNCTLRSRRARRAVAYVYRQLARRSNNLTLIRERVLKIAPMAKKDRARLHGQWVASAGCIYLNESIPNAARIAKVFAHEIGHAVQPPLWIDDVAGEGDGVHDIEAFADWFAARLLVGSHDIAEAHPEAVMWAHNEIGGAQLLNMLCGPSVRILSDDARDTDADIEADLPFAVAYSLARRWNGDIGNWAYLMRRGGEFDAAMDAGCN